MGEDQAEDIEEETAVVDALLGSSEKQAPHRSGRDERQDARPSPKKPRKQGFPGNFSVVSDPATEPPARVISPLRSYRRMEPIRVPRQANEAPPNASMKSREVQHVSPPPAAPQRITDPMALRLDLLEKQFKEGLIAKIENVMANQLAGPLRQKLVAEITASLEAGVLQDVIKRFKLYFTAQVRDVVKAEVKSEVKAEVSKELHAEFQKEIIEARQVTSRLAGSHENLRKVVGEDIKAAVMDDLHKEFLSLLGQARHAGNVIKENLAPLRKEIKNELKAEIKNDIEQKIRKDLPALFRHEIKDELVREISDDIGNPLKRELASEISESVEDDVKEHVRRYMKRQARLAVMNAGSEHPVHLVAIDFNNLFMTASKVTSQLPRIKALLRLLQSVLGEYDDHFVPQRISGHVYASKYHEVTIKRILSAQFSDDPELEQILSQFQLEIQSEKKMDANSQEQKYRDVDVMMATNATALFSNSANKIASVTLINGDGDLDPVLDAAKRLDIYTVVFSFKENLATSSKKKADAFYYLNKPSKFDAVKHARADP